ncbi:MAG: GIY-YIG nuclease family protein, partial [Bacteroidia bacterium]
FQDEELEKPTLTGHIYVLRSKSTHPFIVKNQDILHKIGVTGGDVNLRIVNAKKDPTYLLADVEVVATFKIFDMNRKLLDDLVRRFFSSARLNLEIKDRFGFKTEPREWFLVPLPVIDQAIQLVKNGSIIDYEYDHKKAKIVKIKAKQ